jgi:hypothetical protein
MALPTPFLSSFPFLTQTKMSTLSVTVPVPIAKPEAKKPRAAPKPKPEGDCAICFDAFNNAARGKVQCPYCPAAICRVCAKQYLATDDFAAPKCVDCKAVWSEEFLEGALGKTFMLKEYKECRERVLYETEKARLPESQEEAVRYRTAKEIAEPYRAACAEFRTKVEEEIANDPATAAFKKEEASLRETGKYSDEYFKAYEKYKKMMRKKKAAEPEKTEAIYQALHLADDYGKLNEYEKATATKTAWTFRMKCPLGSCEGFIGMNWACGLCNNKLCSDCHEKVDANPKAGDALHVCNPDTAATVKAIRSEAKPCPKCATMISKIDGCDQMWCTQCKTAFSWRTGNVENHIHNPHYYEWLRRSGNQTELERRAAADRGEAPAAAEGQQCMGWRDLIGRVENLRYGGDNWRRFRNNGEVMLAMNMVRFIRHIHEAELINYAPEQQDENRWWRRNNERRDDAEKKRVLRVRRLVGEINDETWQDQLQRIEKAANKNRRVTQVLELLRDSGADITSQYATQARLNPDHSFTPYMDQIRELSEYCEGEIAKIGKRYNNKMPKWDFMSFATEGVPVAAPALPAADVIVVDE